MHMLAGFCKFAGLVSWEFETGEAAKHDTAVQGSAENTAQVESARYISKMLALC